MIPLMVVLDKAVSVEAFWTRHPHAPAERSDKVPNDESAVTPWALTARTMNCEKKKDVLFSVYFKLEIQPSLPFSS